LLGGKIKKAKKAINNKHLNARGGSVPGHQKTPTIFLLGESKIRGLNNLLGQVSVTVGISEDRCSEWGLKKRLKKTGGRKKGQEKRALEK